MPSTLTELAIRTAKPPASGTTTLWDGSLPNFGVRIAPTGRKTFIVLLGQGRRKALGTHPILSLQEARSEAKRVFAQKVLGKLRPEHITFDRAAALFLEEAAARNRPRTVRDYKWHLSRHFLPKLARRPLDAISTPEIAHIVDGLRQTPGNALHALTTAKVFFSWARRRNYLTTSPAEPLAPPMRHRARQRVLTDDELKRVWDGAAQLGTFGTIVQLLILTGQRRGEIAGLKWSYWLPDAADKAITWPAETTKNGHEHTFPCGDFTWSLLDAAVQANAPVTDSPYVFRSKHGIGHFNGWSKSKARLDRLSGVSDWTLHDLRRTFATNLAALGTPIHVTEKLLNHTSGATGGLVSVYQRHQWWDEQVAAIQKWEAKLQSLLSAR